MFPLVGSSIYNENKSEKRAVNIRQKKFCEHPRKIERKVNCWQYSLPLTDSNGFVTGNFGIINAFCRHVRCKIEKH